ncbi:MAG TPA: hypothetical protein IAA01_11255 [Candidatus Fournierella excrementavium]|nr:hypothetical protein [Candidatus Fournierella excrementavium]
MKKVLSLLLLLPFCFGGCGVESGSPAGAKTPKTFAAFAEVFNRYGIQGASPQLTEDLEQSFSDLPPEVLLSKGAALLTALGEGGYDADAKAWAPSQNGVYAFDMKVSDVGGMYARFLAGVSALAPDELAFENIREDTSKVDWENGTGKRTVTFEWQGEEFTLEAEMQSDWFDLRAANQLNKIIRRHTSGKQLFFTGDGYQECIVFYRDKEWADAFEAETGLELVESF